MSDSLQKNNSEELDMVIELSLPATFTYLDVINSCIFAMLKFAKGLSDATMITYNLQLAAQEACTNIVKHAYDGKEGRINLTLTLANDSSYFAIDSFDEGRSFDITDVPPPRLGEAHMHGYGLFIMKKLMDEVEYKPKPEGNYWHLRKKLA